MIRARAAGSSAIAVALLSAFTLGARADPSSDNRAAAQVLFERGRELVEHTRFAEACPQFAESQRLDPGIGTLLWLADCYENIGQTASAWAAFSQAAADAAEKHDARETVARARAAKLEAALSRLTIFVSPEAAAATDLQIHCDGVPIVSANWSRPFPLDPGAHTITANAAGGRLWWTTVQLQLGSASTAVTVPALSEPLSHAAAAEAPRSENLPPPDVAADASHSRSGHAQRVLAVAVACGGVASILVGSLFSLKAKSRYDDSNAGQCKPDNECTAVGFSDRSSAASMATVATIAMAGGGALIAGAAALYLTAPRGAPVHVALSPNPGGASVAMRWRW